MVKKITRENMLTEELNRQKLHSEILLSVVNDLTSKLVHAKNEIEALKKISKEGYKLGFEQGKKYFIQEGKIKNV